MEKRSSAKPPRAAGKTVAPVAGKRSLRPPAREAQGAPGIVGSAEKPVKGKAAATRGALAKSDSDRVVTEPKKRGRPGRKKTRRQQHGSAWYWKQTDCWYYTLPGTKKRMPLFDDEGVRVRGVESKEAARLALARVKLANELNPAAPLPSAGAEWLVARVCSEYLQYCQRGAEQGSLSVGYHETVKWLLNDLCKFCGALPTGQLKKAHIKTWIDDHPSWKSPATRRAAIAVVQAAFNYATDNHDVPNPIKGLKRPQPRPRLHSFTKQDEEAVLATAAEPFRSFLFAAIHTGLRPYCELAKLTADDVEQSDRGMMWRVYSSKTKKTRKIPVRPEVAELTRKLVETAPAGSGRTLFRNSRETPWRKVAGVSRFIAIRKTLGWDKDPLRSKYSSYTSRHTFAHRMLSGFWNNGVGCSIETLAELIGDTPKVAFDHYGKEWGQHYQDPLWNALGIAKKPIDEKQVNTSGAAPQ